MYSELPFRRNCFAAHVALEGPFGCVQAQVGAEVSALPEPLVAHAALEGRLGRVSAQVGVELGLGGDPFEAHVALEGHGGGGWSTSVRLI